MHIRKKIKKLLPSSLLGRSLLILIVPIVIIQVVSGYVFFNRHWNKMVERFSDNVASEVSLLLHEVAKPNLTDDERSLRLNTIGHYLGFIAKIEPKTQETFNSEVHANIGWERIVADLFVKSLDKKVDNNYSLRFDFSKKKIKLDLEMTDAVLIIEIPERRVFSSSAYIYLLWVFFSSLILLLMAIIFMRNQVRPIRKLAVAADRFGRGYTLDRFKPEGAREVRQAGSSFVEMSKRIKKQLEQRALMLAGISHDLRTPITRLRLAITMSDETEDSKAMLSDLDDMERMINGYLDYVRGESEEEEQDVNLNALLSESLNLFRRSGVDVTLNMANKVPVFIRPIAFSRAIGNVVGNAAKYGEHINVDVKKTREGYIDIMVEDDGPGIDENLYEDVFKPFFRGDKSRSQPSGSVGLGLAIAMDIIHAHGGEISLGKSHTLGGLAVKIALPC